MKLPETPLISKKLDMERPSNGFRIIQQVCYDPTKETSLNNGSTVKLAVARRPVTTGYSIKSKLKIANRGIKEAWIVDRSIPIAFLASVGALLLCILAGFSLWKLSLVFGALSFLNALEMFNAAVELLVGSSAQERDDTGRRIKDISAAAVFAAAIGCILLILMMLVDQWLPR